MTNARTPRALSKVKSHIPFVAHARYPARPGNLVRPLIDGVPAFRRICGAIESAEHSIFATIAFIHDDFELPDERGSLFDVLDRATKRGIDVRLLFWRTDRETERYGATCFVGSPGQRSMLEERGSAVSIRWDRAGEAYCHHQKSWIIDAGHATETAFVGGINLNPASMADPGHRERSGSFHDAYLEVTGPAAADVHQNFVQRWNAASERNQPSGVWGPRGLEDLHPPPHQSPPKGSSVVQIQRTMRAAREHDILEQYVQAIDAAQRTIYIENQALEDHRILSRLNAALCRGVSVIALLPAIAEDSARLTAMRSERQRLRRKFAALGEHTLFTMAGIAGAGADGARRSVYVHAKLMLVDDAFMTIGSCNIRMRSFVRHTEMNASVYDAKVVKALRCELFAEHLEIDTSAMDDLTAARIFADTARTNAQMRDPEWHGNVFAFEASRYTSDW